MMPQHKILKQAIAVMTIVSFAATGYGENCHSAYAQSEVAASSGRGGLPLGQEIDLAEFKIPAQFGRVEEVFEGSNGRTVIVIQDAHAVPDAQRSIRDLIGYFRRQHGLGLVALEGASTPLDPQILKSFPDRERLKKVIGDYLERGEISGVTAAAIVGDIEQDAPSDSRQPIQFFGIEDWPVYEDGLADYLKAVSRKEKILAKLNAIELRLEEKKKKAYSADLLEIDRVLRAFAGNRIEIPEVLRALASKQPLPEGSQLKALAEEALADDVPRTLERKIKRIAEDIRKVLKSQKSEVPASPARRQFNQNLQRFLTSEITPGECALFLMSFVGKNNLPVEIPDSLRKVAERHRTLRGIQGAAIFREFETYARSVKEAYLGTETEKALDQKSERLGLLRKLTTLELRQADWQELETRRSDARSEIHEEKQTDLFAPHRAFYRNAERRDKVFAEKIRALTGKPGGKISAVVAGGFHTKGLAERLKALGFSYVLIVPEIGSLPAQTVYEKQMRGEVSWEKYFEVRNGKIDLYSAFVRGMRDRLLYSQESLDPGPQTKKEHGASMDRGLSAMDGALAKRWRDQILRDLASGRQLERAGESTRFLDEIKSEGAFGEKPIFELSSSNFEIFRSQWFSNISGFMKGLRRLENEKQMTADNILKLLPGSAMQAAYAVGISHDRLKGQTRYPGRAGKIAIARGEMRAEQRFFYPPESTAAYELIRALQLEKTTILGEKVEEFNQETVFIQTIECSDLLSEGYRILSELGPPGLRRFDLLYDDRGYLFAILPRPDIRDLSEPQPPGYRFFLLTEYFIDIPQPGDLPDEDVARLWADLKKTEIAQTAVISMYLKEIYGDHARDISDYYPRLGRNRQQPYGYAELDLKTGRLEMTDFSALTFRAAEYNKRKAGKAQIIFPVFPTVYSPAAWWHRNSDREYLSAIYPGEDAVARGKDFLGLDARDRILVPFTGSGFDSWMLHQAVLCRARLENKGAAVDAKTLAPIRVIDKNPLAVANSITLAKIGGFPLIGKVADNIIGPYGVPSYNEKFSVVAANMPFYYPGGRFNRSLMDIWDFDSGGVLINFSAGLPLILDQGQDPRVLVWNSPGAISDNFVLRNLETAGKYLRDGEAKPARIFDVREKPFSAHTKGCSIFYMKFSNPQRQSLEAGVVRNRSEGAPGELDTKSDPDKAPEVFRAGQPLDPFEPRRGEFAKTSDAEEDLKNEPLNFRREEDRSELRIAPAEDDEEVAEIYRKEMADLPILAHLGTNSQVPRHLRFSKEVLRLMPLKSMLSDGLLRIMGYFPSSEGQYALILGSGKPEITRIYPSPAPLEYHRISYLRGGTKTIDFVFQIRLGQVQMRIVNARTKKDLEEGEIEGLAQQTSDPAGFREFARQMSAGKPLRQILAGPQSPGAQDRGGARSEMRVPSRVSALAGWAVKALTLFLVEVPYDILKLVARLTIRWFSDSDRAQMTAWTVMFLCMIWGMNAYLMREGDRAIVPEQAAAVPTEATSQAAGVDSIGEFYRKIETATEELRSFSPHADPSRYADRIRRLLTLIEEYRRLTVSLQENPAAMSVRSTEVKNYEAWDLARSLGALLVKAADADLGEVSGPLRSAFEEQTKILQTQDPSKKIFLDGLKEEIGRSDRERAVFLKALEADDPGTFERYVARSFHAEDKSESDPALKMRVQKFSGAWKQSPRPRDFDRFRYAVWVGAGSFLESDQAISAIPGYREKEKRMREEEKMQEENKRQAESRKLDVGSWKFEEEKVQAERGDGWRTRNQSHREAEAAPFPKTSLPDQSPEGWHARRRSELRSDATVPGAAQREIKSSVDLLFNAGFSEFTLAGSKDLLWLRERRFREYDIRMGFVRKLIQETADELALRTGQPILAQVYGSALYLQDENGFVPEAAVDDIDIQFSYFMNGAIERLFVTALTDKLKDLSPELSAEIQEPNRVQTEKYFLINRRTNQKILLSFHRLTHGTQDDKWQSIREFFERPFVKPVERYLFIERLIGDVRTFEEQRKQYLQDRLPADNVSEGLRMLRKEVEDGTASEVTKGRILDRIHNRILEINAAVRAAVSTTNERGELRELGSAPRAKVRQEPQRLHESEILVSDRFELRGLSQGDDFDFANLAEVANQIRSFEERIKEADQEGAGKLVKDLEIFSNRFYDVWRLKKTEAVERDYLEPLSRLIRLAREKSEGKMPPVMPLRNPKETGSGLSPEVEAAIRILYVHEKALDVLPSLAERDRVFGGSGMLDADVLSRRGVEAFKQLEIKPGERVLEVGAGKFGGVGLVAAIAGAHVTAFENHPDALRELKARLKEVRPQMDSAKGSYEIVEKDFSSEDARKDMPPEGFDHVIATDIITPTAHAAQVNRSSPLTSEPSRILRILRAIAQLKSKNPGSVLLSTPEFYSVQDRFGRPIRTIKKVPFDDDLLRLLKQAGKQAEPEPAYVAVPFSLGVKRGVLFKVQSAGKPESRFELRVDEERIGNLVGQVQNEMSLQEMEALARRLRGTKAWLVKAGANQQMTASVQKAMTELKEKIVRARKGKTEVSPKPGASSVQRSEPHGGSFRSEHRTDARSEETGKTQTAVAAAMLYLAVGLAYLAVNYFVFVPLGDRYLAGAPVLQMGLMGLMGSWVGIPLAAKLQKVLKPEEPLNGRILLRRMLWAVPLSFGFGALLHGYFIFGWLFRLVPDWGILTPFLTALFNQTILAPLLFDPMGYLIGRMTTGGMPYARAVKDMAEDQISYTVLAYVIWLPVIFAGLCFKNPILTYLVTSTGGFVWGAVYLLAVTAKIIPSFQSVRNLKFFRKLQGLYEKPWFGIYVLGATVLLYLGIVARLLFLVDPSPFWTAGVFGTGSTALAVALRKKNIERLYRSGGGRGAREQMQVPNRTGEGSEMRVGKQIQDSGSKIQDEKQRQQPKNDKQGEKIEDQKRAELRGEPEPEEVLRELEYLQEERLVEFFSPYKKGQPHEQEDWEIAAEIRANNKVDEFLNHVKGMIEMRRYAQLRGYIYQFFSRYNLGDIRTLERGGRWEFSVPVLRKYDAGTQDEVLHLEATGFGRAARFIETLGLDLSGDPVEHAARGLDEIHEELMRSRLFVKDDANQFSMKLAPMTGLVDYLKEEIPVWDSPDAPKAARFSIDNPMARIDEPTLLFLRVDPREDREDLVLQIPGETRYQIMNEKRDAFTPIGFLRAGRPYSLLLDHREATQPRFRIATDYILPQDEDYLIGKWEVGDRPILDISVDAVNMIVRVYVAPHLYEELKGIFPLAGYFGFGLDEITYEFIPAAEPGRSELRSNGNDWDAIALDLFRRLEKNPVYRIVRNEVESARRFSPESPDGLTVLKSFVRHALIKTGWSEEGADWGTAELVPRIAGLIDESLRTGTLSWGSRLGGALREAGEQIFGALLSVVAAGLWLCWIAYLKIVNPPHLRSDRYHFDRRLRNVEEALTHADAIVRKEMPARYELLGAVSGLQQALYTNLWIFNIPSERAKMSNRQIAKLVRVHHLGEFLEAKIQTRLEDAEGGVRGDSRSELRIALPPEGMASYELIKTLELERAIAVGVRKPGPEGTSITVQRIELPENNRHRLSGGLRILSSELAPTTDREEKVLETNQFDLVFNDRDYLIAVIPVVPQRVLHRVGFDVLKYFDLSAYHFEIPSLRDARIAEKWEALARQVESDRQAIVKYHKELFGELSGKVSSYSHGIGGVESKSYLYAELNRETGALALHEFNPREFRFFIDFIRSRPDTGAEKIVVPLFPSVYSPAVRQHKKPDEKFYRGIYVSAAEAGTPADFMDLKPTDRVLVPFAGSGLDTWLAYQAMLRRWRQDPSRDHSQLPEFDLTASDKNPLAVANVRSFAKLAGMKIQTGVFDNVISESGETVSERKFDKVIANMPSFKPEVAAYRVMPLESLISYWDKEGGDVLRRFAGGLPAVLNPDSDPRVLVWNTPFFENETILPEKDLVAKILESAGRNVGAGGESGPKVFAVDASYQRTLNYWSAVYRMGFSGRKISPAPSESRSELREFSEVWIWPEMLRISARSVSDRFMMRGGTRFYEPESLFRLSSDGGAGKIPDAEKRYFSYLKLGDEEALDRFAGMMAERIRQRLGNELQHHDDFRIAIQSMSGVRTSASLLAEKVALRLGIRTVRVRTSRPRGIWRGDYSKLSKREKQNYVRKTQAPISAEKRLEFKGKNIIFIDDSLVKGVSLRQMRGLLRKRGAASVYAYYVMDLSASGDPLIEDKFNLGGLDRTQDIVEVVSKILLAKQPVTTKLLQYLTTPRIFNEERRERLLDNLLRGASKDGRADVLLTLYSDFAMVGHEEWVDRIAGRLAVNRSRILPRYAQTSASLWSDEEEHRALADFLRDTDNRVDPRHLPILLGRLGEKPSARDPEASRVFDPRSELREGGEKLTPDVLGRSYYPTLVSNRLMRFLKSGRVILKAFSTESNLSSTPESRSLTSLISSLRGITTSDTVRNSPRRSSTRTATSRAVNLSLSIMGATIANAWGFVNIENSQLEIDEKLTQPEMRSEKPMQEKAIDHGPWPVDREKPKVKTADRGAGIGDRERAELRDAAGKVAMALKPAQGNERFHAMNRQELRKAAEVIERGIDPEALNKELVAVVTEFPLFPIASPIEGEGITPSIVQSELDLLKRQVLEPAVNEKVRDSSYSIGIAFPKSASARDAGALDELMQEVLERDPHLAHVLSVGKERPPKAFWDILRKRHMIPKSVPKPQAKNIELPDEAQGAIPVAMMVNPIQAMNEKLIPVAFEENEAGEDLVKIYGNRLKSAVVVHLARLLKADKTLRQHPEELNQKLIARLHQFENFESPLRWSNQDGKLSVRISAKAVRDYLVARSFSEAA